MSSAGNGSGRSTRQQDQRLQPPPGRRGDANPGARSVRIQSQGVANIQSPAAPPPAPRPKRKNPLNFSKPNPEFVTNFVGSQVETKPFKIHLEVIIYYSPFFKNAFTDAKYEEAKTKVMKLENVDEKVFGLFNNWLYTQDILHADDDAAEPELMELVKLWTTAGEWKIPNLQNQAMQDLKIRIIDEPESPTEDKDAILHQFLVHAYSTKEDTALKRLAVYKMIRVLPFVVLPKEWITELPDGMMVDITDALMKHHNSLPEEHKTPKFLMQHYMVRQNGLHV